MNTVCSSLQPLLRDVVSTKVGICAREIELLEVSSGMPALEKKRNVAINDRFKLKIPVGDQYMSWDVIFNCSLPNCPPDFDLGDVDFFNSVSLESFEETIPTLNMWDHKKDKALINVISELRSAYLKYQVEKLETIDNRCAYEYASLIAESKALADQIEVFVDCNTVHFLIRLDVDLSTILLSADSDAYVLLGVRFGALGSMRSANLIVSPIILRYLGTSLNLPHNIKGDENLCEYVDDVARSVENQILTVVLKQQEKRKCYIFELLRHWGHSVISYDAIEYNNACFLLEKDGFVCTVEVTLPSRFPHQPPSYRLISVYTTNENHPLSQTLSLPYNAMWEVPTMVNNAVCAITNKKIQEFQKQTVGLFKLPN